jgi:hypothetical protein
MSGFVHDMDAREWERVVLGAEVPVLVDYSGGAERELGKDTYHVPRLEAEFYKAMVSAHAGSPEVEEAPDTEGRVGSAR